MTQPRFSQSSSEHTLPEELQHCHRGAQVTRRQLDQITDTEDQIAEEVPVAMIFNGISHAVMMASPNDLEDFATGFSLSEGIVEHSDEIYSIEVLRPTDSLTAGIEIQVAISSQRAALLKQRRRNLTGRTGCGLCGAESLQQAIRPIRKVSKIALISSEAVETAIAQLSQRQPLQSLTGAFHGAAWCSLDGNIQMIREDVGRHNALDKLLGALKRDKVDLTTGFTLVSSRASYEMVHKASSCGVSTLVAVSAPTGLALDLARQSGLNLIGFARQGKHVVYNRSDIPRD